ncbi:uncharacterized protein LOC130178352 isoform X2 [Seriola aureovittata]|uniref:uncharacterized protein LOC130178352 isoform X2 n=1 Tax=Seriola aureovittata TaxID=2871759 RepID=UPI0024BDC670|nr:uncharacterized protein LOC130178352 isoform X2 [Seriola aureovittata]
MIPRWTNMGIPFPPTQPSSNGAMGRKQLGGLPHYLATVILVSATRYEATRKLDALLKENEPAELTKRVSVRPQKYQDDSDVSDPDETQILTQPLQVKKSKALTRKDPAEEFLAMYSDSPPSVIHRDKNLTKTVAELKQEIQDLKEENANLRELLVQDVPDLLKTMKNVIDLAENPKRSSLELTTPPLPPPKFSTVQARFIICRFAVVPPQIFSIQLHIRDCYKGLPVIQGGDPSWDWSHGATLERWPGTQPSSIGSTINAKITELRAKSKIVSVTTTP